MALPQLLGGRVRRKASRGPGAALDHLCGRAGAFHEHHGLTADARACGLGHAEGQRHGDRGVDGVAAGFEDRDARRRGFGRGACDGTREFRVLGGCAVDAQRDQTGAQQRLEHVIGFPISASPPR